MGKLYVFMGKSASGKDTLYREITQRHPKLHPVVTYTTRPRRAGETEGEEYYFVTEEKLWDMERAGQIVECRCYTTIKGPWYYFTAADGQIDFERGDFCLISTLEAYEKIRSFYGVENVVPLYIEVPDFIRIERSLEREKKQPKPCVAEVCRRYLADEEDFSAPRLKEAGITEAICNLDMDTAIRQIEEILERKKG